VSREAVKGLGKLLDKLEELDSLEADKAFEEGLARGAAKAVQRARQLAPVKSGDLRDNLHVGGYTKLTPGYRAVGAYGALKGPIGRGKSMGVLVGSKLPYASRVERGTKFAQPHPYLRPAVDQSEREIAQECDRAIQEIIDRRG
jgi:HK97 gp10 family phage protein